MSVVWLKPYSNSLDGAGLIVRELNENLIVPPGRMRWQEPDVINQEKYVPDVSRTREYVWKLEKRDQEMVTTKVLAAKSVLQFLDLIERDRAGRIKRKGLR